MPKGVKIIISDEQIEQIKSLYKNNTSINKISKITNFKPRIVAKLIKKLGIEIKIHPNEIILNEVQIAEIKKLYDLGLGTRKIASQMELQRNSVKKIIANNNLIKPEKIEKEIPKEKSCSRCFVIKPIEDFAKYLKKGKRLYMTYCKECYNKQSAEKRKPIEEREKEQLEYNILKNKVLILTENNFGARKISKKLNIPRWKVRSIIKELEFDVSKRQNQKKETPTSRVCKICPENGEQLIDNFESFINKKYGYTYYRYICLQCANKKPEKEIKSRYGYSLRVSVTGLIRNALKLDDTSKRYDKNINYLWYSPRQIKLHIESLFSHPDNLVPNHIYWHREDRVWMTWDMWGKVISAVWDDNNPLTWRWHLDHIIPQADLIYKNVDDNNFKICWDLTNLRPFSAKQNIIDGGRRTRHKKK